MYMLYVRSNTYIHTYVGIFLHTYARSEHCNLLQYIELKYIRIYVGKTHTYTYIYTIELSINNVTKESLIKVNKVNSKNVTKIKGNTNQIESVQFFFRRYLMILFDYLHMCYLQIHICISIYTVYIYIYRRRIEKCYH